MKKTVKERLILFLKSIPISQGKFEKECGLSNGYVSNIRSSVSPDKLQLIAQYYPELNTGWLLTGEGSMLKDSLPQTTNNDGNIIYYPEVDASMGETLFTDAPQEVSVAMSIPGFNGCIAINAFGDSMSPLIKSGQIVMLKEWNESFIDWGSVYLVITKSGHRTIKYLKPGTDEQHIVCESVDKERHPAFTIMRDSIQKLFIIKGWVCRDMI